jgi:ligand-binding SRPBCC domain-containing protein
MRVHVLEREQWLPAEPDRVFAFFSDAANLEALTPGWLGFEILTPLPLAPRSGARIDYRLRLAGIPLRWRTRIAAWDPPHGFVDVQESGPFALWEHTHRLLPVGGGILMRDTVRHAPPLGPLGELAYALGVRAALAAIFDFRFARVRERFGAAEESPASPRERAAAPGGRR